MLTDFFEPFVRLERTQLPDGPGCTQTRWTDGTAFLGGVTAVTGTEISAAGVPAVRTTPMLLHEKRVALSQGERIRRVRDGAEYRVCGSSTDMRAPCCASFCFMQVPVERQVNAP